MFKEKTNKFQNEVNKNEQDYGLNHNEIKQNNQKEDSLSPPPT